MVLMLASGNQIAHYTLEEQVGGGASGEVWRANDGARLVALKFMHEALISSDQVLKHLARLEGEIKTLELLVGVQNVPTLYGYDLTFERPYLVMEYVSSPSWERTISSGDMQQIKLLRRLSLLNTIAVTIAEIHRRGVIHRDIKPGNLHGTEKPYLLDYSIAIEKRFAASAEPYVGTAIYMPPPDEHLPDEANDIFSFGLVAYEVLFGQHAIFTPETVRKTMTELHQIAYDALMARTWRMPSRISWAELPVNLRGANLDLLDKVFQRVFAARKLRYTNLLYFIADLHTAIVTPENRQYLDLLPPLLVPRPDAIPNDTDFTIHEARKAYTQTNLSEGEKLRRKLTPSVSRKTRFWRLGRRRE